MGGANNTSITFSHFFSAVAARILIHYTTHTIRNTVAMASDDLGDDEVLNCCSTLFGATLHVPVLLACMCRPKSDVNDRGLKTRRVWVKDLFRRRCIAGLKPR
jgi:hypothetical protein